MRGNPQTELSVYATAAMEEALSAAIEREMRPWVEKMDAASALNTLLGFVQQGFTYMPDQKQFGREKNFFCEENFFYHANDCEDRAVLFAKIVRILLGWNVILLEYDDHVATAVNVPSRRIKGHNIDINGERYIACDPTYIGAPVGMAMPDCKQQKAQIYPLQQSE